MSQLDQLADLSDELFDAHEKELRTAARVAGIRIDPKSAKLVIGHGTRLATMAARNLGQGNGRNGDTEVLGLLHASGRLGGDIARPGVYFVRLVRDDGRRYAALVDADGNEVSRAALKVTRSDEGNVHFTGYYDSGPEVGPGYACVGFTCCNDLSGCISHEACFTL